MIKGLLTAANKEKKALCVDIMRTRCNCTYEKIYDDEQRKYNAMRAQ